MLSRCTELSVIVHRSNRWRSTEVTAICTIPQNFQYNFIFKVLINFLTNETLMFNIKPY